MYYLQYWLQEIGNEILSIEAAEMEAKVLSKMTLNSLEGLSAYVQNVKEKLGNETQRQISARFRQTEQDQQQRLSSIISQLESLKEINQDTLDSKLEETNSFSLLYQFQTWKEAGFQKLNEISPTQALHFSRFVPIQTYQIQDRECITNLSPYRIIKLGRRTP